MSNTLNERVKHIRKIMQLNQKEFSQKIEISQSALSQIEKGLTSLSFSTIENITRKFNVNCNWLVNGAGPIFLLDQSEFDQQEVATEMEGKDGADLRLQHQAYMMENHFLKQEILFLKKEIELLNKTIKLMEEKIG
jgi:transcriptional regulator with XRE-family HTH domain